MKFWIRVYDQVNEIVSEYEVKQTKPDSIMEMMICVYIQLLNYYNNNL